jgi:plasmid stability protein
MMYYTMHRTQILLDDWQHAALKARAQREGRSMSEMLRELLTAQLGTSGTTTGDLAAIEGIGEDRGAYGRDHDRFLYGKPGKRR